MMLGKSDTRYKIGYFKVGLWYIGRLVYSGRKGQVVIALAGTTGTVD